MSTRLIKKLKKEARKSPGKAAVLALLAVVAGWFWAPLAVQLLTSNQQLEVPPVAAGSHSPASGTPNQATQYYDWQQVARGMDADARMRPARVKPDARDPFQAIQPTVPEQETVVVAEPPPPEVDLPPADAGLVLSSTIVGPVRRAARINGKTYREGDTIALPGEAEPLGYQLVHIGPRSVMLSLNKKTYELKMLRTHSVAPATVSVSSDSPDFDPSILESGH